MFDCTVAELKARFNLFSIMPKPVGEAIQVLPSQLFPALIVDKLALQLHVRVCVIVCVYRDVCRLPLFASWKSGMM